MEEYSKIGVAYWCTHGTDVIPTEDLFTPRQDEIVGRIKDSLRKNGLKCSMVTTETFHHPVWSGRSNAGITERARVCSETANKHGGDRA